MRKLPLSQSILWIDQFVVLAKSITKLLMEFWKWTVIFLAIASLCGFCSSAGIETMIHKKIADVVQSIRAKRVSR